MTKRMPKALKIALILILILGVGFGAGFGIFSIWAVNTDVLKDSGMKMIAHRGYSGEYTENTLSAFREAARRDATNSTASRRTYTSPRTAILYATTTMKSIMPTEAI